MTRHLLSQVSTAVTEPDYYSATSACKVNASTLVTSESRRSWPSSLLQLTLLGASVGFGIPETDRPELVTNAYLADSHSRNSSASALTQLKAQREQYSEMPWPSITAFVEDVRAASIAQPREDGRTHLVDMLVARLRTGSAADRWLFEALRQLYIEPAVLADLVHGLAHTSPLHKLGVPLAVPALTHKSAMVRESGTRLIEAWSIHELRGELVDAASREKAAWLADYMRGVASDLA